MKRLLCIISCMNTGGAETFLMKMFRNIDREKYMMDFCVVSKENYYEEEIKKLGGKNVLYSFEVKTTDKII